MIHSIDIKNKAIKLRKAGYSLFEISQKLKVSKSTASIWLRKVNLGLAAQKRLSNRILLSSKKGLQSIQNKRNLVKVEIEKSVMLLQTQIKIHKNIKKLLCAMLFWAEGEKKSLSSVVFINSDPIMISTFLKLFRTSFNLDEKKFRILVHVHEYHNDKLIKKYWSKLTQIPISQFYRSYLKANTKKRIRQNYKGTISVRYYDYKIALELSMIYNRFARSLGA